MHNGKEKTSAKTNAAVPLTRGGGQLQINIWHIQSCKALWGLSNERYDEELHLGAPACICALLRQIDALPSHSIVSLPLGFSADATSRQQYLANLIFFLSFFLEGGGMKGRRVHQRICEEWHLDVPF